MSLYKNKYRIESNHLKDFDYSSAGNYYITICVKGRADLFGTVKNRKMILSQAGEIAAKQWMNLASMFGNINLGEYIFMPDHMHGIIRIRRKTDKTLHDIAGAFKSRSTIAVNKIENKTGRKIWQEGFYDRIIRGDMEYFLAGEYIKNNPVLYEPGMEEKGWYELYKERNKNNL
jgi:REP element-mobilizing transposase RayT